MLELTSTEDLIKQLIISIFDGNKSVDYDAILQEVKLRTAA